ncbi:hypothetical protein K439DRAFT_1612109 [Ramaria rubella]|nr:hypothetical protein K439DRAFT_1612109 [Ramaria rubella]
MAAPLKEYAECCKVLGFDFETEGEAYVDHCCDFCESVHAALPQLTVVQDMAHLKNQILETVSKKSPYRAMLGKDITQAIFSAPGDGKGQPAQFHTKEAQVGNLKRVWEKYEKIQGVWTTESQNTFALQIQHAQQGCLECHHPTCPCHTSGN